MKSLTDFFPAPYFLKMPAVGIDVSEDAVRLVEFKKADGKIALGNYCTKSLRQGTIKGGEILNPNEMKGVLTELRSEYNFDFAYLSLPEEKAYIFRTTVPLAEPSQVRDSIEFKLEENIPLSVSEALFDYSILNPSHKKSDHLDVVVVAMPKQYVLRYTDIIKSAGIFPISLEITPSAIARALLPIHSRETYMIINFQHDMTEVMIVSQGAVQFTSSISIGSDATTLSIEKHFGVSTEEAVKIKKGDIFIKNQEKVELFFSLINTLSALKDEINRLYIYWHTFKGRGDLTVDKISRMILCGDDALLSGLDEYLSIMLQVPVEVANVWQNAFSFDTYVPNMRFNESLDYAAAIGLALADKI